MIIRFLFLLLSFFSDNVCQQTEHFCVLDRSIPHYFLTDKKALNLFDADFFASTRFKPLLFGLLQGIHPYQILLQDNTSDHPYLMIKTTASYVYLVGKPSLQNLEQINNVLSCYKNIVLICDESVQAYFLQRGFYVRPRIEFVYNTHFEYSPPALPEGFSVKTLDKVLFEQSPWFGFISAIYGSTERFLTHGIGYGLVNDQGVCVAQAYGAMMSEKLCEIGVVTHPDYRGNGYILHPAQALIDECLRRNITPIWSCDSTNTASLKTALKLGFTVAHHYAFIKKDA
jgi:hypothetical protein